MAAFIVYLYRLSCRWFLPPPQRGLVHLLVGANMAVCGTVHGGACGVRPEAQIDFFPRRKAAAEPQAAGCTVPSLSPWANIL